PRLMAVEGWEPPATGLKADMVAQFIAAAAQLEAPEFGLAADEVARLAAFARQTPATDWGSAAENLTSGQVVSLIRLFTLAETRFANWEAGANSPVVVLARLLKTRDAYPADLTGWIKANTENRFLPYGSLLDRL
ncbi:MAG: hypothetical protein V3T18_02705, partial [Pseudomonadales bacterium]